MTQTERYASRSLNMSRFHRTDSLRRFIPSAVARRLHVMDLDFVEFCDVCKAPLALIEVTRDVGQWKPTTVLQNLATAASLPAYLIRYTPTADDTDIVSAKVESIILGRRRIIGVMEPRERAEFFVTIHETCGCWNGWRGGGNDQVR